MSLLNRAAAAALVIALSTTGTPRVADAAISSGTCTVTLQFSFSPPLKLAGLSPLGSTSYSFSTVTDVLDMNPLTPAREVCAITPTGVPTPGIGFLLYATGISGSGSSEIAGGLTPWTCEQLALGSGFYNQSWSHTDPMPAPPPVFGSHGITGTWGSWTMAAHFISSTAYLGVMELTVHPLDSAKIAECATTGVSTLRMIGQLAFQDP